MGKRKTKEEKEAEAASKPAVAPHCENCGEPQDKPSPGCVASEHPTKLRK